MIPRQKGPCSSGCSLGTTIFPCSEVMERRDAISSRIASANEPSRSKRKYADDDNHENKSPPRKFKPSDKSVHISSVWQAKKIKKPNAQLCGAFLSGSVPKSKKEDSSRRANSVVDTDSGRRSLLDGSRKVEMAKNLCSGSLVRASNGVTSQPNCSSRYTRVEGASQPKDHCNACVICMAPGCHICCKGKGCKRNYHLSCVNPPLEEIPLGTWYCAFCVKKRIESGVQSVSEGMESVLDAKVGKDEKFLSDMQKEKHYLVKYKGLAFVHSQWIPESQMRMKAPDLVDKYDRIRQTEMALSFSDDWMKPDRLLLRRFLVRPNLTDAWYSKHINTYASCSNEWLVKWKGLGYDQTTWELENSPFLCSCAGRALIKEYFQRREKAREMFEPSRREMALLLKAKKFDKLSRMPDGCPANLDEDHLTSINKLLKFWHGGKNSVLVGDQDRILKSILLILSLQPYSCRPFLVISTISSLSLWQEELIRLMPSINIIVYDGDKNTRKMIQTIEFYEEGGCLMFQVLLSHPDAIIEDLDILKCIVWEAIIVDECQNLKMSNHLEQLSVLASDFRLLLFTEKLKEGMQYLSFLSFLDPKGEEVPVAGNFDLNDECDTYASLSERLAHYVAYDSKEDGLCFSFLNGKCVVKDNALIGNAGKAPYSNICTQARDNRESQSTAPGKDFAKDVMNGSGSVITLSKHEVLEESKAREDSLMPQSCLVRACSDEEDLEGGEIRENWTPLSREAPATSGIMLMQSTASAKDCSKVLKHAGEKEAAVSDEEELEEGEIRESHNGSMCSEQAKLVDEECDLAPRAPLNHLQIKNETLKNEILERQLHLIENICSGRSTELLTRQNHEVKELIFQKNQEREELKKMYIGSFDDYGFERHLRYQHKELMRLHEGGRLKEVKLKEHWINEAKAGSLSTSFGAYPLPETEFKMEKFEFNKSYENNDDMMNSELVTSSSLCLNQVEVVELNSKPTRTKVLYCSSKAEEMLTRVGSSPSQSRSVTLEHLEPQQLPLSPSQNDQHGERHNMLLESEVSSSQPNDMTHIGNDSNGLAIKPGMTNISSKQLEATDFGDNHRVNIPQQNCKMLHSLASLSTTRECDQPTPSIQVPYCTGQKGFTEGREGSSLSKTFIVPGHANVIVSAVPGHASISTETKKNLNNAQQTLLNNPFHAVSYLNTSQTERNSLNGRKVDLCGWSSSHPRSHIYKKRHLTVEHDPELHTSGKKFVRLVHDAGTKQKRSLLNVTQKETSKQQDLVEAFKHASIKSKERAATPQGEFTSTEQKFIKLSRPESSKRPVVSAPCKSGPAPPKLHPSPVADALPFENLRTPSVNVDSAGPSHPKPQTASFSSSPVIPETSFRHRTAANIIIRASIIPCSLAPHLRSKSSMPGQNSSSTH